MTEPEIERRWINVGDIEIREDKSRETPGILTGTLLRYGELAKDRLERFAADALYWDGAVPVNIQHDRRTVLARATPFVEDGLVAVRQKLPDTSRSRDLIAMVRDKVLTGLSSEFIATKDRYVGGVREILRAKLVGISVVDAGSYDTTVAVRERSNVRRRPWY